MHLSRTILSHHRVRYLGALHMDPILNAAERKLAAAKIPVGPREDLSDVEFVVLFRYPDVFLTSQTWQI